MGFLTKNFGKIYYAPNVTREEITSFVFTDSPDELKKTKEGKMFWDKYEASKFYNLPIYAYI